MVTPFMGVWIEISYLNLNFKVTTVTPFMGVWIEILICPFPTVQKAVTPFMGVWIEISIDHIIISNLNSHSLYGSVD